MISKRLMQLTKWVHEPIWISKVKVSLWPLSKVHMKSHSQWMTLTFDIHIGTWTYMNVKGQGHSLTLIQGPYVIHWPWSKVHIWTLDHGQWITLIFDIHRGSCIHLYVHIKTLKNLLWNEKADDLETFYTALGIQAQPKDLSHFLQQFAQATTSKFSTWKNERLSVIPVAINLYLSNSDSFFR